MYDFQLIINFKTKKSFHINCFMVNKKHCNKLVCQLTPNNLDNYNHLFTNAHSFFKQFPLLISFIKIIVY